MKKLTEELIRLYEEARLDPHVPSHVIVQFRTFLNISFKTRLAASSRPVSPSAAPAASTSPQTGGNLWNGKPLGYEFNEKKSVLESKQDAPVAKPVEKVKAPEASLEAQGLTEKQIEGEILKRGGKFHHKAGLAAKKKILNDLMGASS